MHDFAFVFAGFAVGLIVGLTGVGGGSLMTPVLIFFFGVKPHLAIGTDLLFAAFTKMGGTVSMARQRLVPWRVVGLLCAGSIPAALAALWLVHRMGPATAQAQDLMTRTLGILDAPAFALCRDQKLPIKVFSIFKPGALKAVVLGSDEGTLVHV